MALSRIELHPELDRSFGWESGRVRSPILCEGIASWLTDGSQDAHPAMSIINRDA